LPEQFNAAGPECAGAIAYLQKEDGLFASGPFRQSSME
jgi:hypothetical protein